ncbi:MAG: glycoside-pentoside-hexuronide (GPH):cation symporter [Candidatus Binatia bacterium]|nr:glycoside-pentoside-hexuronide (GPH):cation symporter [Candidatus Binatia bacterium]
MTSPPAPNRTRKLGWGLLTLYGLPGMGVNFLYCLVLILYMKFATDVLGLAAGVVGLIFFASRIWDGVSDPLIGSLSDRTSSRLGRRKTWMLASAIPLAGAALAMWAPPRSLEGVGLTVWVGVSVVLFYTAYTLFDVPQMALGAELTEEPKERIRVFGARQILRTVGLFVAGALGAALLQDAVNPREVAFWMVLVAGAATVVLIVWAVLALPAERADYANRGGSDLRRSLRDVWTNPHARLLLLVYFLDQLGTGSIGTLAPYAVTYVVKEPSLLSKMLIAYMVPALVSIPAWVWLGSRFPKRDLWLVAMGLTGLGFGGLFFLHEGSIGLMLGSALVAGVGSGCGSTVGYALKADVIDVDEYRTGERKEGAYFAAWNFVGKLAGGVMVGTVGVTLQVVGFEPNAEQSEGTKFAIRFLMGGVPFLLFFVGLWFFRSFSLTEAEHAAILEEMRGRSA